MVEKSKILRIKKEERGWVGEKTNNPQEDRFVFCVKDERYTKSKEKA